MIFGKSKKYEDLYPLDEEKALVVSGDSYVKLNKLQTVKYRRETKGTIKISHPVTIFEADGYLRLGNILNGELYYSKGYTIYKIGIADVNSGLKATKLYEGIQPYAFEYDESIGVADDGKYITKPKFSIVYQNKAKIYLNDKVLLTAKEMDYEVIGRPTVSDDLIYFEARNSPAPQGWEVWKLNPATLEKEMILKGANPYMRDKILYYSLWNDGKNEFDMRFEHI